MKFYSAIFLSILFCFPGLADDNSLNALITQKLEAPISSQTIDGIRPNWKRLQVFYAARHYQPCWFVSSSFFHKDPTFSKQAEQAVDVLSHADEDGLLPEEYAAAKLGKNLKEVHSEQENLLTELLLSDRVMQYISDIKVGRINTAKILLPLTLPPRHIDIPRLLEQALNSSDLRKQLREFAPPHAEYAALRKKLAEYRTIAAKGGWQKIPVGQSLTPGMEDARVQALAERLQREGYPATAPKNNYYTDGLVEAVKAFQTDHDVHKADGVIGVHTLALLNTPVQERIKQLELNMERWRWLPEDLGDRHLLINIAGFDLEAVEHNQVALHMRVIVGEDQHRTPIFSSTMSEVIFHPYWYAPKRLGIEDILPQIRKNPELAESKGFEMLKVEDGIRTPVDPSTINFNTLTEEDLDQYEFRQRPGPRNALGAIKFRVTNNDDIYLHDTSNPKLFSHDVRSLSNGCIRLSEPKALAEFVLRVVPGWPQSHIDEVYDTPVTDDTEPTSVKLPEPLPVHIMYLTIRATPDGHLHFYDDIYKWDKNLERQEL